jgi:hypothetical protein
VVFDEEEYERNLQRWSVMELPAFRISDWDGTSSDGSVGGVALSMTSDGLQRAVTMSRAVVHRRPDVRGDLIRVTSSRPDSEDDRYSALVNMAVQLVKSQQADDDAAEEHDRRIHGLADRLRDGEFPWTTATLDVDGAATEFDVLIVGDEWAAFTNLDDEVSVEMLGHHEPFADFRLDRFTGAASAGMGAFLDEIQREIGER